MKTIVHTANARDKLLHIEAEGCVINIQVGLTDSEGRAFTKVEIIADGYAGEQRWFVPDQGDLLKSISIKVQQETEEEMRRRRTYEPLLEKPVMYALMRDVFKANDHKTFPLLTCKDKTGVHTLTVEHLRGVGQMPEEYRVYAPNRFMGTYDSPITLGELIIKVWGHLRHWEGEIVSWDFDVPVCGLCWGASFLDKDSICDRCNNTGKDNIK